MANKTDVQKIKALADTGNEEILKTWHDVGDGTHAEKIAALITEIESGDRCDTTF